MTREQVISTTQTLAREMTKLPEDRNYEQIGQLREDLEQEMKRRGLKLSPVFGWCSAREVSFINKKCREEGFSPFSELDCTPCHVTAENKTVVAPWVKTVKQMQYARSMENEMLINVAEEFEVDNEPN